MQEDSVDGVWEPVRVQVDEGENARTNVDLNSLGHCMGRVGWKRENKSGTEGGREGGREYFAIPLSFDKIIIVIIYRYFMFPIIIQHTTSLRRLEHDGPKRVQWHLPWAKITIAKGTLEVASKQWRVVWREGEVDWKLIPRVEVVAAATLQH